MRKSVQAGVVLWGLVGCLGTGCAVPQPPGKGKLSLLREKTTRRHYWLYLPEDYVVQLNKGVTRPVHPTTDNRLWPMVVSFHGMKPFDDCFPQAREWQQESDRYGFIMIAPQLMTSDLFMEFPLNHVHGYVKDDEKCSLAIMREVIDHLPVDRNRVLSTSWSSGGYMAHYMMNRHPDMFSCVAVRQSNFSEGILDPKQVPLYRNKPIAIFWTQNDFVICQVESQRGVQWYMKNGFKDLSWGVFASLGHERTPQSAAALFAMDCRIPPKSPAHFPPVVEHHGRMAQALAYASRSAPRLASETTMLASQQEKAGRQAEPPAASPRREPVRTGGSGTEAGPGTPTARRTIQEPERPGVQGNPKPVVGNRRSEHPTLSNGMESPVTPDRQLWATPGQSKAWNTTPSVNVKQPTEVAATRAPARLSGNEEETPARSLPAAQRTGAVQRNVQNPPKRTSGQTSEDSVKRISSASPTIPEKPMEVSVGPTIPESPTRSVWAPATVPEKPLQVSMAPAPAPARTAPPPRPKNDSLPVRTPAKTPEYAVSGATDRGPAPSKPVPVTPVVTASPVPSGGSGSRRDSGRVEVVVDQRWVTSPSTVSFRAIVPAGAAQGADYLWTDNGIPICNEQTGTKLLVEPGTHRIEVLIITRDDRELRGGTSVEVSAKNGRRQTRDYGTFR